MSLLRQSANSATGVTPFPNVTQQGSLLVVLMQVQNGAVLGPQALVCSDTAGNVYTALPQRANLNLHVFSQVFYAINKAGGNNVVTGVNNTPPNITPIVVVHEFVTVDTIDQNAFAAGVGNAQDSGPITTTRQYSLVFGYESGINALGQATVAPGAGWTQAEVLPGSFLTQYRPAPAKGTFNSTTSTTTVKGGTASWVEEVMSFFSVDLQVGQIYTPDGSYPPPLQPGGTGTPVTMPIQTDGEKLGLWVAGCQHWFNHWNVFSATVKGQAAALICCPVCGYIQRIITPYSAIHSDANMIILA